MQLTDKYTPRAIQDFIGLTAAKAITTRFLDRPYKSSWLYLGASGIGKTTFAMSLQRKLGGQLYHVPAKDCDLAKVTWLREQCAYRPWMGDWNVVVVDEADQMSLSAQLAFLSVLDGTNTPDDTVFVFTANETEKLQERFLSRCKQITFEAPSVNEIAAHLQRIWEAEKTGKVKPPDFEAIVRAARLNIRTAMNTLENELLAPGSFKPPKRAHGLENTHVTRIDDTREMRDNREGENTTKHMPKTTRRKKLYTIGYDGGLTPDKLSAIMDHLGITLILDCRSVPSSRIKGWHGTALAKYFGPRYQMQGDQLGGRQKGINDAGIEWLAEFMATTSETPVLLCKEAESGNCHRHHRVAVPLYERFKIDAIHVYDDQLITASELQRSIDQDCDYEFESFELAAAKAS